MASFVFLSGDSCRKSRSRWLFIPFLILFPLRLFAAETYFVSAGLSYYKSAAPTPEESCDLLISNYYPNFGDQYVSGSKCYYNKNNGYWGNVNIIQATCPTSNPDYDVQAGCAAPPVECPSQGDVVRLAQVVNGFYDSNGVFVRDNGSDQPPAIDIGGSVSADGCGFARSTDSAFNKDVFCGKYNDTSIICWENYISTGQALDPEPDQLYTVIKENLSAVNETEGSTDTRKDKSSQVVSDPITSTDPDGTQVTTEQTTQIDTRGSGTVISQTEDKVFISETDGIIKNKVTTQTTYEYPDGSKQVVTEERTEYTQTPITNYTIDNSGQTITVNASAGSSASQTKTTTDNFDANGNKTGSSSETTQQGDGDAKENQEGDEFCKENPGDPSCKEYDGPEGDGQYKPGDKTYSDVFSDFTTSLESSEMYSAATGFFDLQVSGSCEAWAVNTWVFTVVFDQHCDPSLTQALSIAGAVLLAVASWLAFRIAFL